MRAVTSEIVAALREDLAAGRPSAVADLVESKILPLFDFQRMTRIAAGSGTLSGYRDQEVPAWY